MPGDVCVGLRKKPKKKVENDLTSVEGDTLPVSPVTVCVCIVCTGYTVTQASLAHARFITHDEGIYIITDELTQDWNTYIIRAKRQ